MTAWRFRPCPSDTYSVPDRPQRAAESGHDAEATACLATLERALAAEGSDLRVGYDGLLGGLFVARGTEALDWVRERCFGFARAVCMSCRTGFVVAFSCKGRGVCPSCNGRHMAQTAAHLADHVIPPVPVRQWVISVPQRLRAHSPARRHGRRAWGRRSRHGRLLRRESESNPRTGDPGDGLRRGVKIATPGGKAAVPGAADQAPENAAPASPAAHRLGHAYRHGCGSAVDRTIFRARGTQWLRWPMSAQKPNAASLSTTSML
jgi:hypothetical protein